MDDQFRDATKMVVKYPFAVHLEWDAQFALDGIFLAAGAAILGRVEPKSTLR